MEQRVEIPATDNPAQGEVISDFEITPKRLQQGRDLVASKLEFFKTQRSGWTTLNIMRDRAYRAQLEPPRESHSNQQVNQSIGRAYVGFDDKASPLMNDNVEAIKARLKESIIPIDSDYVELEGSTIDPRLLDLRQEELNKQLELVDLERKLDTVVHNAVVFGTFFVDVPLLNSQDEVLTRQLVTNSEPITDNEGLPILDDQGNPYMQKVQSVQVVKEIDIKYFGPGYEPIKDNEDIYMDMYIQDIQDQQIVIRKYVVDWDHLMDGVEAGIYIEENVKKIKDVFSSVNSDQASRSEIINAGIRSDNFTQGSDSESSPKEYLMYKAYCDFAVSETDREGNKTTEIHKMVISIIGNEVIQMMPNPYFHQMTPILKGTYRDIPGESYGMGAIDTSLDMYHEYNDTMNQINDSKILSLNPIKIVAGRSLADKRDLEVYPGAEWHEKQPGDIRFAQFDFSTVSNGLQYLELLEQKINRGMGIQRLMQGAGDQTDLDKTATGVSKVIEQADKKFRMIAKRIENVAIKEWAEMAYKVNVQFNPFPINSTFREINSQTNFHVKGVENFFDKLEANNKLVYFTQQGAGIPGFNLTGFMMQIAKDQNIVLDEEFGPMFVQQPPEEPEDKPMNVSVTMPIDMTKGTLPAMAAAQILSQKGIQLDLDAIGEAATVITEETPRNIKEESGILPQERKQSVHTIKTGQGSTSSEEVERTTDFTTL